MNLSTLWGQLRITFSEWNEDDAPRMGASLAFYTLLSLAPMLIVVIGIAGLVFGYPAVSKAVDLLDREYRGFVVMLRRSLRSLYRTAGGAQPDLACAPKAGTRIHGERAGAAVQLWPGLAVGFMLLSRAGCQRQHCRRG